MFVCVIFIVTVNMRYYLGICVYFPFLSTFILYVSCLYFTGVAPFYTIPLLQRADVYHMLVSKNMFACPDITNEFSFFFFFFTADRRHRSKSRQEFRDLNIY